MTVTAKVRLPLGMLVRYCPKCGQHVALEAVSAFSKTYVCPSARGCGTRYRLDMTNEAMHTLVAL